MKKDLEYYKIVKDKRAPVLIEHSKICRPKAIDQDLIDRADTSYPGIVIEYDTGYLIEDGVHRIAKLQQQEIYESLFYVVTISEYKSGIVNMVCGNKEIALGEWNHNALDPRPHTY